MTRRSPAMIVAAALLLGPILAGCTSDGNAAASAGGRLRVEASFYPLQWVAEQVGGSEVTVANLTASGAEPHDLELTPRDVATLGDADLVLYLSDFQPAVDGAVATSGATAFDVAPAARLDRTRSGESADRQVDPHFWLDPTRLRDVATAVGAELARIDPGHAGSYRANARALAGRLDQLDREFDGVLADCQARQLVTSHQAFGYLAQRYGLEQVAVAGLSPGQEPSARQLARVARLVERDRVRTVYVEPLASPAVARTVAREAGARTAVLDPIEGLTDSSAGSDYLSIMRADLGVLRTGQPCP